MLDWFKVTEVHIEAGQSTVEYALVLGLVSIAAVSVIGTISVVVKGQFEGVATFLSGLIP